MDSTLRVIKLKVHDATCSEALLRLAVGIAHMRLMTKLTLTLPDPNRPSRCLSRTTLKRTQREKLIPHRSTVSTLTRLVAPLGRAEPIDLLGSATRFGRVSATRQYSVLGHHKPAKTEY